MIFGPTRAAARGAQDFCKLAEELLEQHLREIGVTSEQFVKACEWGRHRRDINRMVFDQIMAIDDYLSASPLPREPSRRGDDASRRFLSPGPAQPSRR